jgi:hypothetical protein
VTIVEMTPRLIGREDEDVSQAVRGSSRPRGDRGPHGAEASAGTRAAGVTVGMIARSCNDGKWTHTLSYWSYPTPTPLYSLSGHSIPISSPPYSFYSTPPLISILNPVLFTAPLDPPQLSLIFHNRKSSFTISLI